MAYLKIVEISLTAEEASAFNLGESETCITDPIEQEKVLGKAWAPTFSKSAEISSAARSLLKRYAASVCWDWSKGTVPGTDSFASFLEFVKHSAPGEDGVPYAAWKALGEEGVDILFNAFNDLMIGIKPDKRFNRSMWIFPPKKNASPRTPRLLWV